jgi:general secretion pathway protein M
MIRRWLEIGRTQWTALTPRERILAQLALGLLVALVVSWTLFSVSSSIGEVDAANGETRALLRQLARQRAEIRDRERDRLLSERRFSRAAPPLGTFLDSTAQAVGLEIAESQDRPESPHGTQWTERSSEIRMRKIGLRPLVDFMTHVENSGYPMAVTKLHVRKRYNENDSYDIEMTVSTYVRRDERGAPGRPAAPGKARPPRPPLPPRPPPPGAPTRTERDLDSTRKDQG